MSSAPNSSPRQEDGFSVVETLVALFVFALAGVGLISMQTQSIDTYDRVETRALASIVAENQLIDAMALRTPPPIGAQDGETELGGRKWRWRLDVIATYDQATVRIDASVFAAGEEAPSATVSAYRLSGAVS
ncbi:MAG: type II secretion system minor pseudopilin GspI [Hyphomonadaceae bacterium]